MNHRPLISYLAILAALCAGFVLGAKMLGAHGNYLAQGYMLTPAIAAVITRLAFYPPRFRDANLRFGRAADYLKVWLAALGITATSFLLYTVLGAVEWDFTGSAFLERITGEFGLSGEAMMASLPPGFTVQSMLLLFTLGNFTVFNLIPGLINGFGEEFGHRGLMFPLLSRFHPWVGLVGGGLLWFLWHQPLALILPTPSGLEPGDMLARVLLSATASIFGFVYFAYIYVKSRSIFVTSIAHIAMNNASAGLSYYITVKDQMLADLGLTLTMALVVVILHLSKRLSVFESLKSKSEAVQGIAVAVGDPTSQEV